MGSGDVKQIKPALQRIEVLEKDVRALFGNSRNIMEGANKAFSLVQEKTDSLELLCNVLVELAGPALVEETLKRQISENATKRADAEKQAIVAAAADGAIKPVDTIAVNSLVVARETLKDGTVRHPGWMQILMADANKDAHERLVGKKVGDVVEVPAGTLEILEVYEFVADKYKKPATVVTANTVNPIPAETPAEEPELALPEASEADVEKALDAYLDSAKETTVTA